MPKSGQYLQAFRKKVRKTETDRRTDGLTDGLTKRTDCKPKVPFGCAGKGLKNVGVFFFLFYGKGNILRKGEKDYSDKNVLPQFWDYVIKPKRVNQFYSNFIEQR